MVKRTNALIREPRRSNYGYEVTGTRLPGKGTKLQILNDRTPNRHRWSGREYQGAWENSGEGTRQKCTVTSGEGTLRGVKSQRLELQSAADKWWLGLFNKNTALCKPERGSIGCDTCPVPEG